MSIPPGLLRQVKIIASHQNCPDGIASALIAKDAVPDAEVVFLGYGTREHAELEAKPGMLFVDMTPPRERAKEFVDAGAIVLDHHKHACDIVEAFGERGVFADEEKEPGVSGAVLAHREVWVPLFGAREGHSMRASNVRDFATAAGMRDTWQKMDAMWEAGCAQAEMLMFYGEATCMERGLSWAMDGAQFGLGLELVRKARRAARDAADGAFRMKTQGGTRVAVVHDYAATSDAADLLDVDVVASFRYLYEGDGVDDWPHLKMNVSLRSRGVVDVGAIAKRFGGGGHKGAAGFTLPAPNQLPHLAIRDAIQTALG